MSITVRDGEVIVNVPVYVTNEGIDSFVNSKTSWINRHIKEQKEQKKLKNSFNLDYGDNILYLGQTLRIKDSKSMAIYIADGNIYIPEGLGQAELKRIIKDFYKKEARHVIKEKAIRYSELMNVNPGRIKISGAETRWGSCSTKGNVNFSWYLMMAAEAEIDYVVIHELAHLTEMNHSERFWKIVKDFVPDYKEKRTNLRILSRKLLKENWK